MELTPTAFLLFLGVPLLFGHALLRRAGIGPRTDALAYPGWVWMAGMLGVAVPLGSTNYFLKMTGPAKTVAPRREEFLKFVETARPDQ